MTLDDGKAWWKERKGWQFSSNLGFPRSRLTSTAFRSSLFFFFFFKERVTLIGWMRVVPRLRLLEIREICRTGENWLAKRQVKERNESTFQSIMFHLDSPGTRMCKDLSLSLLLFPFDRSNRSHPCKLFWSGWRGKLGFLRGYFVGYFFFFLGNGVFHGLPVKLLTRPLFNFARISIFKTGRGEKVRSKPSIYGLM